MTFPATSLFQYQQVRLIALYCERSRCRNQISIPTGAIDSACADPKDEYVLEFQYQQVRLIARENGLWDTAYAQFQYQQVRLIGFNAFIDKGEKPIFQYQQVRLIVL